MRRVLVLGGAFLGIAAVAILILILFATAKLHGPKIDQAPELGSGLREVQESLAKKFMVASANELATRAGVKIIKAGGSAVDAAVAVQMVLNLVEPQSSGIGGGAFMLYYDAGERVLRAFDGRETAPGAVTPNLFLNQDGTPRGYRESVVGGLAVGVPGVLQLLAKVHAAYGKLPWAQLFTPAIELAESGFMMSPRLHKLIEADAYLRNMPGTRQYFFNQEGRPKPVGTLMKNPELAKVFQALAHGGVDAFYKGAMAQTMVKAVREAKQPSALATSVTTTLAGLGYDAPSWVGKARVPSPGMLSMDDLAGYQAKERRPVCMPYRKWRVCGMPPPTSGGITVLQILGILSRFDVSKGGPYNVDHLHLLAEAERLAYADRNTFIADPDFVDVPVDALIATSYLHGRANQISRHRTMERARPGDPTGDGRGSRLQPDRSIEYPSTTHFSIFDAQGNVVSMTSSIEQAFGSHVWVDGFLLNNQLTDFSFQPTNENQTVVNSVAPNKRPRSSMSPMIVFDLETDEPILAIGSPGGSRIIAYVAQAMVGILDWRLSPQQAVNLPHIVNLNGVTELENVGWPVGALTQTQDALGKLGHRIAVLTQNSGIHAIMRTETELRGASDPRREGLALGE